MSGEFKKNFKSQKCYFDDLDKEMCFETKCQDFFPKSSWEWVIYGVSYCPYCQKAKELLDKEKIKYYYFDVEKAPFNGKEEYKTLMKTHLKGHKTFPAIFHKGKLLGGFSDLANYFDDQF